MEATLTVSHTQYTDAFFNNLSSSHHPESTPAPTSHPTPQETSQPSQPSKFPDLYLDPQPVVEPPQPVVEPHQPVVEKTPTTQTHNSKLPVLVYDKRTWTLHQHEDLQPRISAAKVTIEEETRKRKELLERELQFFDKVNATEASLREKMLRDDQRQTVVGVCGTERTAVISCLRSFRDCASEIGLWKKCENSRT